MRQKDMLNIWTDQVSLDMCLQLSLIIFVLSLFGLLYNRKNLFLSLIFLEALFFSVSLNFIFIGFFINNPLGYIVSVIVITISASETVIGVCLLIIVYRINYYVSFDFLINLRG